LKGFNTVSLRVATLTWRHGMSLNAFMLRLFRDASANDPEVSALDNPGARPGPLLGACLLAYGWLNPTTNSSNATNTVRSSFLVNPALCLTSSKWL